MCEADVELNCLSMGLKVIYSSSVVARMHKNVALNDFAGPNRQVYQVAVSGDQRLSLYGLEMLFLASEHIDDNGGVLMKSEDADQMGKISFYWVVPEERAESWKRKAPRTILKKNALLLDCLHNYVDQYVLVMSNIPLGL